MSLEDLRWRNAQWERVEGEIHDFFKGRGFECVRTPILVQSPGMEPNLDPFETKVRVLRDGVTEIRAGLITSPEYSMKKLLGAGFPAIYTLTPVFRNQERPGIRWSHEFTMLEWYRQGQDYTACMEETKELVMRLVSGLPEVWPRISYVEEYQKHTGIHPADETRSPEEVADLFEAEVMPKLLAEHEAFFLSNYPVPQAALAAAAADGRSAERFEAYVRGLEICNGFTELVNAETQRARFLLEAEERRAAGKTVFPIDEGLLSALSSVSSPTHGNALGVDRLVMLSAGVRDIDQIHLFPPSERF